MRLPESPQDTEFFVSAVTGYWNMFKQNIGIMVAVDQLAAVRPRFAALQNEFRRFGIDIVRASVLRAQDQGYGAELDPEHTALAISLLFERFTTVYLREDTSMLGVASTDENAVRTLSTIWKKTLYGF
jgi:AcrR family transcriptional regulator